MSMSINPIQDGKYQASLRLDNGQSARSVPFDTTDAASHWSSCYAEEAGKASDESYSPEVQAGLQSEYIPGQQPIAEQ